MYDTVYNKIKKLIDENDVFNYENIIHENMKMYISDLRFGHKNAITFD